MATPKRFKPLDDHHGDGRLAPSCKAVPEGQEELVGSDAALVFVPPYAGKAGFPVKRFSSALAALALSALAGTAFVTVEAADAPPAAVILVRHAEKAAEPSGDQALSQAGRARAAALADALRDSGVTAIVTSQFARTQETARPLAAALSVKPEIVPVASADVPAHVAAVVAAVRRHPGEIVLVVGHSNTLPAIAAALSGTKQPDICESQYASLFILVPAGATMRIVRSRYGDPDPSPGPECR